MAKDIEGKAMHRENRPESNSLAHQALMLTESRRIIYVWIIISEYHVLLLSMCLLTCFLYPIVGCMVDTQEGHSFCRHSWWLRTHKRTMSLPTLKTQPDLLGKLDSNWILQVSLCLDVSGIPIFLQLTKSSNIYLTRLEEFRAMHLCKVGRWICIRIGLWEIQKNNPSKGENRARLVSFLGCLSLAWDSACWINHRTSPES